MARYGARRHGTRKAGVAGPLGVWPMFRVWPAIFFRISPRLAEAGPACRQPKKEIYEGSRALSSARDILLLSPVAAQYNLSVLRPLPTCWRGYLQLLSVAEASPVTPATGAAWDIQLCQNGIDLPVLRGHFVGTNIFVHTVDERIHVGRRRAPVPCAVSAVF
ncbi:hypothetical protein GGX14DRAFT_395868 [Mycena pura]|uniref:Uncharacterized protein n=1 Tax=Mycena pura TaxID=153505 RepID=A0AAD6YE06_9AGAR|nr:hypothetical protein GGX14DRAFT_395868 [Mycena pura]